MEHNMENYNEEIDSRQEKMCERNLNLLNRMFNFWEETISLMENCVHEAKASPCQEQIKNLTAVGGTVNKNLSILIKLERLEFEKYISLKKIRIVSEEANMELLYMIRHFPAQLYNQIQAALSPSMFKEIREGKIGLDQANPSQTKQKLRKQEEIDEGLKRYEDEIKRDYLARTGKGGDTASGLQARKEALDFLDELHLERGYAIEKPADLWDDPRFAPPPPAPIMPWDEPA
jgi:hypothetical protein